MNISSGRWQLTEANEVKQNNEHQDKGRKKFALFFNYFLFFCRLFVVSRHSYSSFVLNNEPLVVVSLVLRPYVYWSRYVRDKLAHVDLAGMCVTEKLELWNIGNSCLLDTSSTLVSTKRRLVQADKVCVRVYYKRLWVHRVKFRLSSPNRIKAVQAGRTACGPITAWKLAKLFTEACTNNHGSLIN